VNLRNEIVRLGDNHGAGFQGLARLRIFPFIPKPRNCESRGTIPNAIKITHHKTGAVIWHPLEEITEHGTVRFYSDAEAVLARLPRRGVAMILKARRDGMTEPYDRHEMAKIVRKIRDPLVSNGTLSETFTLDACRHGGMTELEEAELTDGQGGALSGHRTQRAYEGYAKRTLERALPATRKRYAHALANAQGTSVQNATRSGVQNEPDINDASIA
jgi:hypothetical protein